MDIDSPILKHSISPAAVLLMMMLVGGGCAGNSASGVDPFEAAEEGDLLDAPVRPAQRRQGTRRASSSGGGDSNEDVMFIIPEAQRQPGRPVDTSGQGWDFDRLRQADEQRYVFAGHDQWQGPADASFEAAVETDDSYVYVWVHVTDDDVLASSPDNPDDAVLIWLRDPRLESLLEALPAGLRDHLDLSTETGLAITADGAFAPLHDDQAIDPNALHIATATTDKGYIVEAALPIEILPAVGSLPVPEIALRLDVYDTDESDRGSSPTRLSAFPGDPGQEPRFAAADTPGLLPSVAPASPPPRPDAWGIWRYQNGQWTFQPLEYLSAQWHRIDSPSSTQEVLRRHIDELPSLCGDPDGQLHTVEAYRQTNGNYRVALSLCGPTAGDANCPGGARSQAVWTALQRQSDDEWTVEHAETVFERDLRQCVDAPRDGEEFATSFSLLPFDVIGSWVFGVGWHRSLETDDQHLHEVSVTFVDPRSQDFVIGSTRLRRQAAGPTERTLQQGRVYLTDLEGNDRMDLCHVEEVQDQICAGLNRGCRTGERDYQVITQIDLWDDEEHRFGRYPMDRYGDCRGSMTLDDIDGYRILLIGERLGLIRSPRRIQ